MANNGYEDKLIEAIQYVVQNAVDNAPFDRTVQATIVSCIDQTIGKYKCKYQDAIFYAYATSSNNQYNPGNDVYVLIPANDTSREKTILGTTKKLGPDFAVVPEGEEAFAPIGANCIENNNTFNLCSYKTTDTIIYDSTKNDNQLRININNINRYIKQATSIIIAAKFKTSLPIEQQFRGNYGLIFDIILKDNATGKQVTRNYILDVNQMKGNPYKINNYSREYGVFDIDGANLIKIDKVHLFCYDFPNQDNNKPNDIEISNIELTAASALSAEELASTALTLITPRGTWFDNTNTVVDIQAQVKIKGKNIDVNSQQLEYYWFVENIGITTISEKYNKYGGLGWECLNKFNLVKAGENGKAPVVEWNPGSFSISVNKNQCPAKETKYKCVVVYNGNQVSKEIILTNYDSNYLISIDSDSGTKFYYDIGTPTLTTKVNGSERISSDYTYLWAMTDNNNNFFSLSETTSDNQVYNDAAAAKQQLETQIKNEEAMPAANKSTLEGYMTILKNYDTIMRVEKNKLHKVQINTITNFATYKCAVYYKGTYIGTASIVLTNSLSNDNGYSLVINNGSQVFKYNEDGVAPTSNSVENPYEPLALSFTIFNNLGEALSDDIAKQCKIRWAVPEENSMVSATNAHLPIDEDLVNHYKIYNDYTLNYQIDSRYNVAKKNNNIQLQVTYKEMTLTTETDFTFAKEGDPGTNGTEFLCRIVPNTNSNLDGLMPMIVDNGNARLPNFTPINNGKWFRVELWHSGEKIFSGVSSGQSSENKSVIVNWSMLRNKYTSNVSDTGTINVTADGTFSAIAYDGLNSPANIVKCQITYDKVIYYATLPLITTRIVDNYQVGLYENTGFQFATYGADGRKPSYDNAKPFKIKVTNLINGVREDISEMTKTNAVTYSWYIRGEKYHNKKWQNEENIKVNTYLKDLARNEKSFKPNDDYDTETVNNAIECILTKDNSEVAKIHIPIHLLLNKYGHKELNGWDGNSIQINNDGGFILAPEIGAGEKDNQNRFTGVLMGKVKEANHTKYYIGLHGYSAGTRTIFLNAENGSTILGKQGTGQIVIDPSTDKGYIYSSQFWKDFGEDGLPTNYGETNENKQGMLIDLTTPAIRWGNGNFSVNTDGHLIAKGGGSIAGWKIDDTRIYSESGGNNPNVTMDSERASIYSNNKNQMISTRNGFYIGSDGFALGAYNSVQGHNPFQVNQEGYLVSTSGTIGNFNISEYKLVGGTGSSQVGMCSTSGQAWAFWAGSEDSGTAPFHVGHNGSLYSTSGEIGGWTIGTSRLSGGDAYLDKSGAIGGKNWSITSGGAATFTDVIITNGGYSRGTANLIDYGSNFKVSSTGTLSAKNAKFEGSISGSSISGGTVSGATITRWCYRCNYKKWWIFKSGYKYKSPWSISFKRSWWNCYGWSSLCKRN